MKKFIKIIYDFSFTIFYSLFFRIYLLFGKNKTNPNSESIVTLTSYSSRLNTVWITIASVLFRNINIKKIILWVSNNEKQQINKKLYKLVNFGLEIRFCDDLMSYKKIVFAAKQYYDYQLITIDDDIIYPNKYIDNLIKTSKKYNDNFICCYVAHQITFSRNKIDKYINWNLKSNNILGPRFDLIAIGYGAILYPKLFFLNYNFDMMVFKIAPKTDDIYLKFLELSKAVPVIKVYSNKKLHLPNIFKTQLKALYKTNMLGDNNDLSIEKLESYYNTSLFELISSLKEKYDYEGN